MPALSFDGTDDRLGRLGSPVTAAPFTVCAWVRRANIGSQRQVVAITANNSNFHGWYLYQNTGTVTHESFDGTTSTAVASTTIADSTWESVSFIEAATNDRRCFVAGANKGTNTATRNPTVGTPYLTVGAYQSNTGGSTVSQFFQGHMAYVFIWSTTLTDGEVSSWHGGTIPQQPSLVAFYDLTVDAVGGVYSNLANPGTYDLTVTGATFDAGQAGPSTTYSLGAAATSLPPVQPFRQLSSLYRR